MRKIAILFVLFTLVLSSKGLTQSIATPISDLGRIAQQLQSGIYERIINLGYISSPHDYRRRNIELAHNEFTMLFFRFDTFEATADTTAWVGKIFISERYLEKDYNKKYTSREIYRNDKDGKFMVCKLYFDERSLEYRLNVYPNHILNICRKSSRPFKGMHFNKDICTSNEQHWQSLKYVVSLNDKHYDDFSRQDDTTAIRQFLKSVNPLINIDSDYLSKPIAQNTADSIDFYPTLKQQYPIREINFRKQIKIFKVADLDDDLTDRGKILSLKFTKYALSEDLLEGTEYSHKLIPFDSLINNNLKKRGQPGEFISRNPLYRSLITSNEPDDMFVPGIEVTSKLHLSYQNQNKFLSSDDQQVVTYSKTEQQNESLKKQQENISELKQQPNSMPVRAPLPGQVDISSKTKRTNFWVYVGRSAASAKSVQKGNMLRLSSNQYLRDTIPILNNKERIWLKGKISFYNENYFINPKSGKINWIVDTIQIVKDVHLWVRVSPTIITTKNKKG